jgi:exodeoxyribonuclease VII large subunit
MAEPVDCIVVTRGGGSLEDLWTFNEERVVRAIFASQIPLVSAIGHEIDVTLADLVADVRALTPSEAAERVAPAAEEVAAGLAQWQQRLAAALGNRLASARARLDTAARQRPFRRPFALVQDRQRLLDELETRSGRDIRRIVERCRQVVGTLAARLETLSPLAVLGRGYSLTQRADNGKIVRASAELTPGDLLDTRFAHGQARSRVEAVDTGQP